MKWTQQPEHFLEEQFSPDRVGANLAIQNGVLHKFRPNSEGLSSTLSLIFLQHLRDFSVLLEDPALTMMTVSVRICSVMWSDIWRNNLGLIQVKNKTLLLHVWMRLFTGPNGEYESFAHPNMQTNTGFKIQEFPFKSDRITPFKTLHSPLSPTGFNY